MCVEPLLVYAVLIVQLKVDVTTLVSFVTPDFVPIIRISVVQCFPPFPLKIQVTRS